MFHCFICLFLCQYKTVFIPNVLNFMMKPGIMIPLALLLFCLSLFYLFGVSSVLCQFWIFFPRYENVCGTLLGSHWIYKVIFYYGYLNYIIFRFLNMLFYFLQNIYLVIYLLIWKTELRRRERENLPSIGPLPKQPGQLRLCQAAPAVRSFFHVSHISARART